MLVEGKDGLGSMVFEVGVFDWGVFIYVILVLSSWMEREFF